MMVPPGYWIDVNRVIIVEHLGIDSLAARVSLIGIHRALAIYGGVENYIY